MNEALFCEYQTTTGKILFMETADFPAKVQGYVRWLEQQILERRRISEQVNAVPCPTLHDSDDDAA